MTECLLLIACQLLTPASATELFLAGCAAGLADPAAFRANAARMGFAPVEERGRAVLYRAAQVELLYAPNESCELRGRIDPQVEPGRVVGAVSSALGLTEPVAIAMHPPGWARYRWPVRDGDDPRFYLAARTIIDHERGTGLELSIHRGPAQ